MATTDPEPPIDATAALHASEERYRTLFEAIDEGLCVIELVYDADERLVDLVFRQVNAAFKRHTGLHDVVDRTVGEILPTFEQHWLDIYARVARTGIPERSENYVRDVDRWYRVHQSRIGGVGSRFVAVVFEDISERKRADLALLHSEEQQAFLLALSDELRPLADPVAIQGIAAQRLGEYLNVSRALYYAVEPSAQGDVHVIERDFYRDPDVPSLVGRHPQATFGGALFAPLRHGNTIVVPDVSAIPTMTAVELEQYRSLQCEAFVAVPLMKYGRHVAGFIVKQASPRAWRPHDVLLVEAVAERTWSAVERAHADAKLQETQRRLEEALLTARMAYWDWDPTTDVIVASVSMDDVLGLLADERFESSAQGFALVHPDDRWAHKALVMRASLRGEGWHAEFRIIRPRDGTICWLEERATVTRDQYTGVAHTTGLVWDITDRKRAEAATAAERRTQERDTLRRALAEAEEAERRRLAQELHDQLGQELTAFRLGLDNAVRLAATHDGAQSATDAPLYTRLAQLQLLARRMTAGARAIALDLWPPELNDMGLSSALETYLREWSARYGITGEVAVTDVDDHPIPTHVASALYRIVQEALTNVAKHARATQVSVIVEPRDGEMHLIVEDNGTGFDVETTHERTRRERRLGLASMQERAALFGGMVTLESSPGNGTTLFVRLPINAKTESE